MGSDSTRMFGPFRLLGRIGQGGTGIVYRATRGDDPAVLALKILTADAGRDETWRRRFEREALLMRRLQHPNIVSLVDYGEQDGCCFMAMEFVRGHSGRELVERRLKSDVLARLAAQLCNGLAAAHEQGLIHRDLKPENIVVTPEGRAKILDFGLARPIEGAGHDLPVHLVEVTSAGVFVGTARYMSPEQSRGESLTPATDLFCLGLCLFELAAGQHPFASPFAQEVITAIRERSTPQLRRWRSDLPDAFADLVAVLLSKDPVARPSAKDAAAQFRSLVPRSQP